MSTEIENNEEGTSVTGKKPKRGIIYLSSIPPYMNVSRIREYFTEFGTVDRIYLQLAETKIPTKSDDKKPSKKRKFGKKFTEGWVEFERKSVAKKVAQFLNNTQVNTKKSSKQYDHIWNIKYLSNFKWIHLHERLSYEKAARRQMIRTDIQAAKKKTNYLTLNLDKQKKNKNLLNEGLPQANKKNKHKEDKNEFAEHRGEFFENLFD